ncbi:MAG: FAD-dependent oxidoreductase [Blautia marasmi]
MNKKTVCIIGGGAAGLVSAIFAARNHASVILLEQNEKPEENFWRPETADVI